MKMHSLTLLNLLVLLALVLISVLLYPELPERLPSSFNMHGEVLATRPREVVLVTFPGIYLLVMLLMQLLVRYSPQKFSMPNSKRALEVGILGTGILFGFIHYAMLRNDGDFDFFVRYFNWGMALFLLIVGNILGKTERNFMLGIRLPWTINSDANWRATHRLCGRLTVFAGIVLLALNSFYAHIVLTLSLTLSPFLVATIYSFYYYQANEQNP